MTLPGFINLTSAASTKGIGKAIAEAFVEQKAKVIIHGRSREEAEKVCSSIGAYAFVDGDIGTEEGSDSIIQQITLLGEVEILVNNAGIFGAQDFFEANDDDWLRYYQVNVMSVVRLCRALMPAMLKKIRVESSIYQVNLQSNHCHK